MLLVFDRILNKIKREYKNRIFNLKTGYKANLVGNMTLINTNILIGKNVTIYPNVMFFGDGKIEIGDNVDIGNNTIIYASKSGGVTIGNNSMIAANCYIIDTDHGIKKDVLIRNQENTVKPVTIGNDVWIAANSVILKGSIIEDGAVVGAKSLVKGKVEKNAIVVGSPATILKYRK